jgi:uncharacterized protein (DUF433 family)
MPWQAKRRHGQCKQTAHWGIDVTQPIIHRDPQIQGGAPVFAGTRVPLKNLFDSLEAGDTLDQFLEDYPSVTREHALAALASRFAQHSVKRACPTRSGVAGAAP